MNYQDSRINLVINKLSKRQYDALVLSNMISDDQLYLITDDGGQLTAKSRYDLVSKRLELSSVTIDGTSVQALTCKADDLAINTIQVSSNAYPVYVYLPDIPNQGARDFCVRIECLSSSIPTVGFFGTNESCDFESEYDNWATLEVGANLFNFTETKR